MSQIQRKFLASNSVDGTKIRLSNAEALRARNAANTADVNILSVDSSNTIQFASVPQSPSDAVNPNDVVRFSQLSSVVEGLKPKAAVAAATTGPGTLASSFAAGSAIDGYTLVTGDRLLIKDQVAPAENGIYTVNATGAPTRALDFNAPSEIPGSYTAAEFGTANAGVLFVSLSSPTVIGIDPILFTERAAQTYTGGDMIALSGSAFSVDLATNSGLASTNPGNAAGQLKVSIEASNPSLQVNASGELGVKAGSALASASGGLSVQVDNSTIEVNSNALRVKDAGITLAKLAANSVDENKIVSTSWNTAGAISGGSGTKISVVVDAATVKINGSNQLEALKRLEQSVTLSGTDITNQFIDLAHAVWGTSASVNSVQVSVIGGPVQQKTVDYTVSLTGGSGGVTRISFAGDLATGGAAALVAADIVVVTYDYLT